MLQVIFNKNYIILDWLDNGNNKKALQETEKVLKKTPSLQAARALKALSLLRLGRGEEAHSVLTALAEERPSDDSTLQAMTMTYRECQQCEYNNINKNSLYLSQVHIFIP